MYNPEGKLNKLYTEDRIEQPMVSVVIPCYNQGEFIEDAINSVLKQTYKNIEIICINDGSKDNSSEIIHKLANKHKTIHFLNFEDNKGVIEARNSGIDFSCNKEGGGSKYILPLDADDTIESTYIEKAVDVLEKNPQIGMVYCKANLFGEKTRYWNLPEYDEISFLYNNCIFCSALFRTKDFIKAGKYKQNMKNGYEDWDLWLSFIELGLKPHRIDEVLFNYRQYPQLSRSDISNKEFENCKREILKNHLNLYLKDSEITEKIFTDVKKLKRKHLKYKKLYALFMISTIFLSVLLFIAVGVLVCSRL